MKKTTYIYDNVESATRRFDVLLNQGYEVVTTKLISMGPEDDYELFFAAVLTKEV